MTTYIKKPPTVEAVQFFGYESMPDIIKLGLPFGRRTCEASVTSDYKLITYNIENGAIFFKRGDWVVKDEDGEFSCCSPEDFKRLYEPEPIQEWLE